MSKKQFTLDSWLKDKSQKVVTRCGFPVRIVCTDVKRKDYPILALVERDDQEEYQSFTKDGRFSLYNPLHDNFDLFIVTDEVSEDEKIKKRITLCLEECVHSDVIRDYEKDECIAWLEKQGQVKESTISQHENRTCEENGNSLTYEDEKVRKEIINYFRCQSEEEPTRKEIHNKWIAWLEKQGEQKPEENKGNIGGISSNWSEEDEEMMAAIEHHLNICKDPITYIKPIKGRVQHQSRWKPSDEQIRALKHAFNDGSITFAEMEILATLYEGLKSII